MNIGKYAVARLGSISLGIVLVGASQASILFDDFTSGPYSKSLTSGSDLNVQSGTMVGNSRTTSMLVEVNPFNQSYELSVGNGFAISNSGASVDGRLTLRYGYESNGLGGTVTDDLNLNLVGQDRIRANFLSNDRNLSVAVSIMSNSGANISSASQVIAGAQFTPFTKDFMFSDFVGVTDLSDIDQISLTFDTLPSGDFALGNITAVPEPISLIAIGLGIAGVVSRRRRKS